MDFFRMEGLGEGSSFERLIAEGVELCPFLRNIRQPTSFCFSSPLNFPIAAQGNRGPIFEDGPNFESAFRLFHGCDGVVPLSRTTRGIIKDSECLANNAEASSTKFHPLAASAAAISLSAPGASGPFGFEAFMARRNDKMKENKMREEKEQQTKKKSSSDTTANGHEAWSNEWLQHGNCPIAKSFRAASGVLPLVAKMLQPPPGMKVHCPPAVVAARAALARTAAVKALRPQPLPTKLLAVGLLGMALNIPLGIWREHTLKFSPSWFIAVHASVPFIAMLRKAVHIPKHAMAFTIAASILGQVIGSRAERKRLELAPTVADGVVPEEETEVVKIEPVAVVMNTEVPSSVFGNKGENNPFRSNECGKETWVSFKASRSPPDPVGAY